MWYRSAVLSLVLSCLLAPVSGAQAPDVALEIKDAPMSPVLSDRDVAIVALNVTFRAQNFACSSASQFEVGMVAGAEQTPTGDGSASSGNATTQVVPNQLRFPVAAGAYGSNVGLPAGAVYQATQAVAVSVQGPGLPNLTTYAVTVLATFRAGGPSECRGTTALPEQTATAGFDVAFNRSAPSGTPLPEVPVPWGLGPVSVVLAIMLGRKRA